LAQDSSGETLSPTQFGFCLLLPAILVGSRSPSLNDLDVIVNTACALALWPPQANANATPPASKRLRFTAMIFPPFGLICGSIDRAVRPSRRVYRSAGEHGNNDRAG
jgi:hypothetical protein